jgi:predicted peptidase
VPADGPELLCALADHVMKTQPVVDPRRVYLFGHSAGAVFTLNMAMLEPQYFAAAALHAGAWRSPDEFVYLDVAVRKIPMGIWVGDRDAFFAVRDVNATADALAKAGHPVKVEIIKNHDHNYYVMSSDVNRAAWAFLKTCQLETDPQYIAHRFQ